MSATRPKLDKQFGLHELGNGNWVVRHAKLGARFAVNHDEASLIQEIDGQKDLDELQEIYRTKRGAFAFQDLQLLLFQLWSHGLLENAEEIRGELFSEHGTPEYVKDSIWRKLKFISSFQWMPKQLNGDSHPGVARLGLMLRSNRLLWLGVLISLLPLPLLYYGKLDIPNVFFRREGSWISGIALAYVSLSLILSYRGFIRAAVAASFEHFQFRAGLQIRLGVAYFDIEDEHIDFLPANLQIRFALAGLAAIGGVTGLCAALGVVGGPSALSFFMVSGFILGIIDLCPLMPTNGERLIESIFDVRRPENVRRYISQRMVRDLMVRHEDDFGSTAYPIVASLWIVWFGIALEVFQRFILADILALQTTIWNTDWMALKVVGGAFFLYVVLILVAVSGALVFLAIQMLAQILSPDRVAKPQETSAPKDLNDQQKEALRNGLHDVIAAHASEQELLDAMLDRMHIVNFKAGAWIQRAGRKDHRFFFVLNGAVDLLHCHQDGRHEFVATMSSSESFGDEGLTGHSPLHDAKAKSKCQLACLDGDVFQALVADFADDQSSQILQRATFLDGVPELSGLGAAGRLRLAFASSDRQTSPKEVIVKEGDQPQAMYIIKSGRVDVAQQSGGENRVVANLGPGQTFGELGLLRGEPRNATVITSDKTDLIEIPKAALENALGSAFHVGLALEQLGHSRLANEA